MSTDKKKNRVLSEDDIASIWEGVFTMKTIYIWDISGDELCCIDVNRGKVPQEGDILTIDGLDFEVVSIEESKTCIDVNVVRYIV